MPTVLNAEATTDQNLGITSSSMTLVIPDRPYAILSGDRTTTTDSSSPSNKSGSKHVAKKKKLSSGESGPTVHGSYASLKAAASTARDESAPLATLEASELPQAQAADGERAPEQDACARRAHASGIRHALHAEARERSARACVAEAARRRSDGSMAS